MSQISKMERISYIDSLRGFLLLLVILGHTAYGYMGTGNGSPLENTMIYFFVRSTYGFHMHAFFALSGYLYTNKHFHSIRDIMQDIVKKGISLGIPYLLCSVVYWGIKYTMGHLLQSPISIRTLMEIPIKPIEFFWYLYALLIIYILADCIDYFCKNRTLLMCVFLVFAAVLGERDDLNIFVMALSYMGYFYLGSVMGERTEKLNSNRAVILCAFSSIFSLVIFLYTQTAPAKCLFAVSMTMFLILLAMSCPCFQTRSFLQELGKQSMPVYIMHVTVVAAIRIVLIKLGINNPWIHLSAGFAGGLICPWIVYQLLIKKVPFLDFFFYPGKYLRNVLKL